MLNEINSTPLKLLVKLRETFKDDPQLKGRYDSQTESALPSRNGRLGEVTNSDQERCLQI